MAERSEYMHTMRAKLEEWNHELHLLDKKAEWIAADLREQYLFDIELLKAKLAHGLESLEQLDRASDEAYEDLKAGLEAAWAAIAEAFESIKIRFINRMGG